MKKQVKELKVSDIRHAEWNPRSTAELDPASVGIQELAKSIKENGQLHPIGVWADGDDLVAIYGNRRLEAMKVAGMDTVLAVVWSGISEAEAQAKTREENENRLGVDPMQDAALIKKMIDGGMSQTDVADKTGFSEAMVCRRMKLCELDRENVEQLVALDKFDTKALEFLAAQPKDMQVKIAAVLESRGWTQRFNYNAVKSIFNEQTAIVDGSSWIYDSDAGREQLAKCRACPMCTGCQQDLFAESNEPCRCLDVSCFSRIRKEAKRALVEAAIVGAGGDISKSKEEKNLYWGVMSDLKAKKATKGKPFAHYYFADGMVTVRFGEDPKREAAERKRVEEEAQATAEAQRALREGAEMTIEKFFGCLDDDYSKLEAELANCFIGECREMWYEAAFYDLALTVNEMDDDATREDFVGLFTANDAKVFASSLMVVFGQVLMNSFMAGWCGRRKNRAWAVNHFPKLRSMLSPEETALILDDAKDDE